MSVRNQDSSKKVYCKFSEIERLKYYTNSSKEPKNLTQYFTKVSSLCTDPPSPPEKTIFPEGRGVCTQATKCLVT